MAFLLDVNVLIARIDFRHEHHERVIRWEHDNASERLVSCPLTQTGSSGSMAIRDILTGPGHRPRRW